MIELSAPEHRFVVVDPQLLFTEGDEHPTMRFQLCEERQPRRFARSGKHIHLQIPNDAAMQLLASLKGYQKYRGLPELTPPQARVGRTPGGPSGTSAAVSASPPLYRVWLRWMNRQLVHRPK
jgi:hypothetical protein